METDDVIKRIIMLSLLVFILPGYNSDLVKILYFFNFVILLVGIIFLSMSQIERLNNIVSDNLVEKSVWVVVFLSVVANLISRIIISIS